MGYSKVVVAVFAFLLIQTLVSANHFEETYAKLGALKARAQILKQSNKLQAVQTRDITACMSTLTDIGSQAQSLFGIWTQTFNFFQQVATELGQCATGGAAGATTCITDIIGKFTTYIQSVQSEVTKAFTGFGQDVGKLASCLSAPSS